MKIEQNAERQLAEEEKRQGLERGRALLKRIGKPRKREDVYVEGRSLDEIEFAMLDPSGVEVYRTLNGDDKAARVVQLTVLERSLEGGVRLTQSTGTDELLTTCPNCSHSFVPRSS